VTGSERRTDGGTGARKRRAERIRDLMRTEGPAVAEGTKGFNAGRYESVGRLDDYEGLKGRARAIKEDAIERLPDLLDDVTEAVEANGGEVYLAADAADANRYVREVARGVEADRVVKSKSMTTEELELNRALTDDGVDVVETDLGEWVLQVAEESPSHIVAPAIHKSREAIADLFNERFDPEEPLETAKELTAFAREHLLAKIRQADVGVTGANFVTADSGTLALVTSEGNARKTAVVPDTHVAVAGVEKLIPTVEDLAPFVELIGRSGTGQDITSYVSLLTPPVESPTMDYDSPDEPLGDPGDRSFHLVLVDNGRMAMREDEHLKETLYCIRCSACANSCANFQHVGGHAFGGETYSGGIATGWEAAVEGYDVAAEFTDFCTGCSRCTTACPVEIDIPWINEVVRDRIAHGAGGEYDWLVDGLTPDEEAGGYGRTERLVGNFDALARWGSRLAPVSNWVADSRPARALADRLLGIDARRALPRFSRETLVDWFEARGGSRVPRAAAGREAVVYPDTYTNYVAVERGRAAVRTLEALGVRVHVPQVASSGRAPLSQGMIATAGERAGEVYETLIDHVAAGRDVVVVEPSDLAMFRHDYRRFLDEAAFEELSDASYEVLEYVHGLLANGGDAEALAAPAPRGRRLAYHAHCQQRTLGLADHTVAVLESLGYDVACSDVECCGMAGSFGYKSDYYELSMDVGEDLRRQFTAEELADRTVVASGTSCLEQLESLLVRRPRHPVELLAPPE
jgi:iron-sulfur cluster protein